MHGTHARGATFAEFLLVGMILGLVAALAAPNLHRLMRSSRLTNAARMVWLDVPRARLMAIKHQKDVKQQTSIRVDFYPTYYTIVRVYTDSTEVVALARNLSGVSAPGGSPRGVYPGVTFDTVHMPSTSVTFASTGAATNSTTIMLQGATDSKSFTIALSGRLVPLQALILG